MFSQTTLDLFDSLLAQVQVPAAAPNFEELAAAVSLAKKELAAMRGDPDAEVMLLPNRAARRAAASAKTNGVAK